MASYLPIPQTEEPSPAILHPHQRKRGGRCFRFARCASKLALFLALLSLFSLAFLHLRSPREVSLSAFEVYPIRDCKSWFQGAEVSVPSSSSDFVSVHKLNLDDIQVKVRDYSLGYNVTLYSDEYSPKSHIREYHFDAVSPFAVSFESSSPVFFFVKTEAKTHRDHRDKHHNKHRGDRKHEEIKHSAVETEQFEASPARHGPTGNFTHPKLVAATRGIQQMRPSLGKYTFVLSLPKNSLDSVVDIRVKFDAKIATLAFDDCPFMSSLREGRSFVHFNKHEKHIKHVITASPHTPAGTIAHVKLVPKTHKFLFIAASCFVAFIVLRLVGRFARCHAKKNCNRAQNNGERRPCIWSRLFKKREQLQQPFVHVVAEVPSRPSAPVYTPQI
eukprot:TRINITY_DN7_c0_g4_i2.p1 TRINITY_DN7_c0_g4~~TRINITY_DN7_c0_g4_i2.p1  ORF type:complete len:387 (-),score=109.65 TRINITY_DN7_c0_g4_i2:136-1296(-)